MLDTVNGIPTHPLMVHFAVVLTLLATVLGVLWIIPRTRRWAIWPFPIMSIGAMITVFLAKQSGERLEGRVEGSGALERLIHDHAEAADLMFVLTIIFAVLSVVAWWLSTQRAERLRGGIGIGLSALIVAGVLGMSIQMYRVGDMGAKAVWNHSVQLQPVGAEGDGD